MSLQILLNGLFLGAIYVNIAVGFSLAWGVMDVINVAHGTMIVVGAFVTFACFKMLGLDPFLSLPISMAVLFVIGYGSQKYLLNLVVKIGIFLSLILTFGLDLVLINALLMIFTGDYRSITPSYSGSSFQLGSLVIPYVRLATLVNCFLLTALLPLFLSKTLTGNAIRATAQEQSERLRGEGDAERARIFARAYGRDPEFAAFWGAPARSPIQQPFGHSPDTALRPSDYRRHEEVQ